MFLNIFLSSKKLSNKCQFLHFWGPGIHFFTLNIPKHLLHQVNSSFCIKVVGQVYDTIKKIAIVS